MRRSDEADGTIIIVLDEPNEIHRWRNCYKTLTEAQDLLAELSEIDCSSEDGALSGISTINGGSFNFLHFFGNPLKIKVLIENA